MHHLWFGIDKYIFKVQTFEILEYQTIILLNQLLKSEHNVQLDNKPSIIQNIIVIT
jgi:hypothetical protein